MNFTDFTDCFISNTIPLLLYFTFCIIGYNANDHEQFGTLVLAEIHERTKDADKKRKPYMKWTAEERYNVGKFASQNGIAAAVRHFKP